VAQTFFMDDEVAECYLLDSIVTLVDAKHAGAQLDTRQEARRQVGFADRIFISKTDLVTPAEVDALVHRLKHMNPRAPQKAVHFGQVSLQEVFDLRGFNLNATLAITTTITIMSTASTATTRTTTPTTTTSSPSCFAPTAPSTRPSWKTSWVRSCRSTGPRCCATRACST
jgi:G3E family GTPase